MFSTSTQKKYWTFSNQTEIDELRAKANENYKARYRPYLNFEEQEAFLSPKEEMNLCKIITETGIKFGEDFDPPLRPSVRWIAFVYYKRFYLYQSPMEYFPKNVMMVCYYLATKVDEFNISIDNFVSNLRHGSKESNIETITKLEPEIISKLKYHLTIHCPFRPLEGHLINMKAKFSMGFDLEVVRPYCTEYLKKTLASDVVLLYPPSQIALAALQYGLKKIGVENEILREYLFKITEMDLYALNAKQAILIEKLFLRFDDITKLINESAESVSVTDSKTLQAKMQIIVAMQPKLDLIIQQTTHCEKTEPFDSDEDY